MLVTINILELSIERVVAEERGGEDSNSSGKGLTEQAVNPKRRGHEEMMIL